MRFLITFTMVVAWLVLLNRHAERGSRRAMLALGMTLILIATAHVALGIAFLSVSGMFSGHGGRGGSLHIAPGDDTALWILGGVFAALWPGWLALVGVGQIRRARAPTPPAAPPSRPRR